MCILVESYGQGYWLSIDPAKGVPVINVEGGPGFDLKGHYEDLGCVVVETETQSAGPPRWSWALANCVGVVKYVLGIRAPFVITPFQLYKRLTRC